MGYNYGLWRSKANLLHSKFRLWWELDVGSTLILGSGNMVRI
jgi:hypothetical protein